MTAPNTVAMRGERGLIGGWQVQNMSRVGWPQTKIALRDPERKWGCDILANGTPHVLLSRSQPLTPCLILYCQIGVGNIVAGNWPWRMHASQIIIMTAFKNSIEKPLVSYWQGVKAV